MLKPISKFSVSSRKFDPIVGWVGLVCFLLLISSLRVVFQSEPRPDLIEQNRFRVAVNQATVAELMALPDLGPQTARKIVEYREQNGPFTEIDQLLRVQGIGTETLRSLRPLLLVSSSEDTDESLAKN